MHADYEDQLYGKARSFVVSSQRASSAGLQHRFGIGYARAARLMDLLEEAHVIGPADGSHPRRVLVKPGVDWRRALPIAFAFLFFAAGVAFGFALASRL